MRASALYSKAYYRLDDHRSLDLLIKKWDKFCE